MAVLWVNTTYAFTIPPADGFVNDTTGILTIQQTQSLEAYISTVQQETSNEIGVLIVSTLQGETIEEVANQAFRQWGIGTKEHNNGVLLMVSTADRALRIEVGYGLEGAIPDLLANQIIQYEITPSFKAGDYYTGIRSGVEAIAQAAQNEYVPATFANKLWQHWQQYWAAIISLALAFFAMLYYKKSRLYFLLFLVFCVLAGFACMFLFLFYQVVIVEVGIQPAVLFGAVIGIYVGFIARQAIPYYVTQPKYTKVMGSMIGFYTVVAWLFLSWIGALVTLFCLLSVVAFIRHMYTRSWHEPIHNAYTEFLAKEALRRKNSRSSSSSSSSGFSSSSSRSSSSFSGGSSGGGGASGRW